MGSRLIGPRFTCRVQTRTSKFSASDVYRSSPLTHPAGLFWPSVMSKICEAPSPVAIATRLP